MTNTIQCQLRYHEIIQIKWILLSGATSEIIIIVTVWQDGTILQLIINILAINLTYTHDLFLVQKHSMSARY